MQLKNESEEEAELFLIQKKSSLYRKNFILSFKKKMWALLSRCWNFGEYGLSGMLKNKAELLFFC